MSSNSNQNDDGGYYAIKGFIYQFDKTIATILNNPNSKVEIEQIQDIKVDCYYIQVKHKETQKYTPSKVKRAVIQLLSLSAIYPKKHFKLHCYFKNQPPQKTTLKIQQLDQILGSKKSTFTADAKAHFLSCFELEFTENFDTQFESVLKSIQTTFNLKSKDEAVMRHAVIRSSLLDISIQKSKTKRQIDLKSLHSLLDHQDRVIFNSAYTKYLGVQKYLKYLKKEYFSFPINRPAKERLFVIELDSGTKDIDLVGIANDIKNRYFQKHSSPAPYISFINVNNRRLRGLKQLMWDKGVYFTDGTHFSGDRFRIGDLTADTYNQNHTIPLKIVALKHLNELTKIKGFDRVFYFSVADAEPPKLTKLFKQAVQIEIPNTKSITNLMK